MLLRKHLFSGMPPSVPQAIKRLLVTTAIFLCTGIFAPFSFGSQSSIQARSSYNSEEQTTYMLSGVWGLSEKGYLTGSFVHARSPIQGVSSTEEFFQGALGAGHAFKNLAFDVGLLASTTPLTQITSKGFYLGATYIHAPEDIDPESLSDNALGLLHTQVYEREAGSPFWVRIGFAGNTLTSGQIRGGDNRSKQTSFTIDGYKPIDEELLAGVGVGFYGYDSRSRNFFREAERNLTSLSRYLLSSTLQGQPKTTFNAKLNWQIAPLDTFLPRYQATEIDSTRQWTHTFNLGWRHHFSNAFAATPIYEISIQGNRAFSGIILELNHTL